MSKKKSKPSQTIDRDDILPDFPQDQVQSNGLENAEQKAKQTGPAPD
ncbi:hypothetical protein [Ammoniphilus sp. YIM 78166]|nr:hypothetical protein [Ammoniphilus sp. YIM 78166]